MTRRQERRVLTRTKGQRIRTWWFCRKANVWTNGVIPACAHRACDKAMWYPEEPVWRTIPCGYELSRAVVDNTLAVTREPFTLPSVPERRRARRSEPQAEPLNG